MIAAVASVGTSAVYPGYGVDASYSVMHHNSAPAPAHPDSRRNGRGPRSRCHGSSASSAPTPNCHTREGVPRYASETESPVQRSDRTKAPSASTEVKAVTADRTARPRRAALAAAYTNPAISGAQNR